MVTINTALTTVIWYGTGIQLSSTVLATKSLIVRQVNGTGYSSFDPAPAQAAFNSLQNVTTGAVLIVESPAAAYGAGGYQLDNGTAPVAGSVTVTGRLVQETFTVAPCTTATANFGDLAVYRNGVQQTPGQYTVSGTTTKTITLATALAANEVVSIFYLVAA